MQWEKMATLENEDPRAIVWASRGENGSGKSYFSLTAPGPIFVCAFDQHGLDRVDKTIRAQREIKIGRYGFNPIVYKGDRAKIKAAARPIWDKFLDEYFSALSHMQKLGHGTILWDREDMSWGLRRYAEWGAQKNEGSKTGALDYGDLNEEYIGLVEASRTHGVNLGLLQGLDDEWATKFDPGKQKMTSYSTGKRVPMGMKRLPDHVDITLDHAWDGTKRVYTVTPRKFPQIKDADEKPIKDTPQQDLDFFGMACLAFPDSDPMLWMNQ